MKNHIIYKNIIFFIIFSLINGEEQFDKKNSLNSKTIMTHTSDGSKVLLDKTIPILEVVELTLNNKNSNHASVGDELIIKATASEGIISKKILINGQPLNYIDLTEKQFYANYFFKSTDKNGKVEFEISFSDSSGNQGEIVKSTTNRSKIIFDKTPPSDFTTGAVTSKGGIIRLESWNSTNTHLTVNVPINKDDADSAFDAATCIGCGACVATCKNSSAMLFVGAKVSQYSLLPQGQTEASRRVVNMVNQMDLEGFGNCSNTGACEVECPKGISLDNIARMNRELLKASIKK